MQGKLLNIFVAFALAVVSLVLMFKLNELLARTPTMRLADVAYVYLFAIVCTLGGFALFLTHSILPRVEWDIALGGAFVLLQGSTWLRFANYISGRTNSDAADLCFLYFWVAVLVAFLIWVSYVVLAACQHGRVTQTHNFVRVVAICIMAVSFLLAIFGPGPGTRAFSKGFEKWFSDRKVDTASIRAWQSGLTIPQGDDVPEASWPETIVSLKPRFVRSLGIQGGVDICWGGGFLGIWGVVIGPLGLRVPKVNDTAYFISIQDGEYMHFQML